MVPDDGQLPAKQFGRARKIGRLYDRATSRPLPLDARSRDRRMHSSSYRRHFAKGSRMGRGRTTREFDNSGN